MESDSESTYYYQLRKELRASILVDRTVDCTSAYSHGTRGSTRRASRMSLACGAGSRVDPRANLKVGMLLVHDTYGSRPTSRSCRRPSLWIGRSNLVRKLDRQHPREQTAVTAKDHRQA